jgi:mono/diheme cytochrome c family protein
MRVIAWIVLAAFLTAVPASAQGPAGKASAMFEAYQKGGLPDRFKGRKNPQLKAPEDFQAALKIYQANCAACHGTNADGKGQLAAVMEEKPADLRHMLHQYPNVDAYYFWIVSAGGAGFGIPMPGFERQLSERDIWRLINWMQAGFPGAGKP